MTSLLKIGGSLLYNEKEEILIDRIKKYANIIRENENLKALVCGGGLIARKFIKAGRNLGSKEYILDMMGIEVSRLNAQLLINAIGDIAYPFPIKNIDDAVQTRSLSDKILVAGGFHPGQSTTTVAMEIAESCNIDEILILSDVDGIFDKNPKLHQDAKKFDKINVDKLSKIIVQAAGDNQSAAGEYRIFDALSIQLFKRNSIKIRLMNGTKYDEISQILSENFDQSKVGTLIIND